MSAFVRGLVHEAYAAHAVLTQLGFEPEHVFIEIQNVVHAEPPLCVTVTLKRDGKQFVYVVMPVTRGQAEAFMPAMAEFIERKNARAIPRDQLDAIVNRSRIWRDKVDLLVGLHNKGFDFEVGRMAN